uniref:Uncharacterized protein n=1 Tax=Rhizophora mucronata TaxID=61149 RepID=A0A2P2JAH2_RHIMU
MYWPPLSAVLWVSSSAQQPKQLMI